MKKISSKHLSLLYITLAFFVGVSISSIGYVAFAQTAPDNLIHACVKNSSGSVRIVSTGTSCNSNETATTWPSQPGNNGLPLTCPNCDFLTFLGNRFQGKDLSNSYLPQARFDGANLSQTKFINSELDEANFSNSTLTSADFTNSSGDFDVSFANATGANFANLHNGFSGTNAILKNTNFTNSTIIACNLPNADIDGANFTGSNTSGCKFVMANLENDNFTGAIVSGNGGPTYFDNSDLTNANFTNADLTGALNMNTANTTAVTWSNTTCPDGTNSNNDGNTCVGHF